MNALLFTEIKIYAAIFDSFVTYLARSGYIASEGTVSRTENNGFAVEMR